MWIDTSLFYCHVEIRRKLIVQDLASTDPSSTYYLSSEDVLGMSITEYTFTRENYDLWVKASINGHETKEKLGFVNEDYAQPNSKTRAEYQAW